MLMRYDELFPDLIVFEDSPKRTLKSIEDRGGYIIREDPYPQGQLFDNQKEFPEDGFINTYCRRTNY